MSLTRKAATAAKKPGKPRREDLAEALTAREAELAEARRQNMGLLREAVERQTATADILKIIASSPTDVRPVFEAIATSANTLTGGFSTAVLRFVGDAIHLVAFTPTNPTADEALAASFPQPLAEFPPFVLVRDGETVQFVDTEADYVPPLNRELARLRGYRSMLFTPLMSKGAAIGMISVTRKEPGPFAAHHVQLLGTFADQAVIAIENARLFQEVQAKTRDLEEALQQQTATADVLKVISRSAFDLQAVLDTLVHSAAELSDSSSGIIYLQDDNAFHIKAHFGMRAEFVRYLEQNPQKPGGGSIGGRVLLTGAVQNIPDAQVDEEYDPFLKSNSTTRALLGVPLLRGGKIVGGIFLARARAVAFSQRQIELVQTFADQAVIAIENVRLFDEVQARTRDLEEALQQQTATANVLKVISRSAFDLQTVLDTLVRSAVALCDASGGMIYLKDRDAFYGRAFAGYGEQFVHHLESNPQLPGRRSVGARVLLTGQVQNIPDLQIDPEYDPHLLATTQHRAVLGVPLLRDKTIVGAIVVGRQAPDAFAQREIEFVQTFADQAVIAIENTRLFDEVQARTRDLSEALMQQTATADVLKAISRSAFHLDTVLETLIETALRLCNATYGQIFRRHGDFYRCAASRMDVDPAYLHHEQTAEIAPGRGTLIGRVALENRAVEIVDAWNDLEYAEKEEAHVRNVRAMLGVPLMRDGEMIGAFALGRAEPIPFSQRQVDLVATFADQAVIAIENVRLFDEVQAKTRDLEESLQQQTATADVLKVISRSAFDLQSVFDTLIGSAVELSGSYSGAICVRDGEIFRYRASSGPGASPELHNYLVEHPATPGRGSIVGRAVLSRQVEEIPDLLEDAEYSVPISSHGNAARALLGVPLLGKERVEGAIVLTRLEPGGFSNRQIEILQTFADQAVIAIENARLFDEVQARTGELSASLDDLRKAQDRLVQSEKLASLGQLTAGIAHEIKNPLNFINNYSALSRELIDELSEAIKGVPVEEATRNEADELIGAIGGNLDKVVQHGKRADSIVKNMLLHSRGLGRASDDQYQRDGRGGA